MTTWYVSWYCYDVAMTPCCRKRKHCHFVRFYVTIVNRRCIFLVYYCSSKGSSKQAWQNSSYFSRLHCAMYTHNMAAATLVLSNGVIVTLSMNVVFSFYTVSQKTVHLIFEYNFGSSGPIFTLILLAHFWENAAFIHHKYFHLTSNVLVTTLLCKIWLIKITIRLSLMQ